MKWQHLPHAFLTAALLALGCSESSDGEGDSGEATAGSNANIGSGGSGEAGSSPASGQAGAASGGTTSSAGTPNEGDAGLGRGFGDVVCATPTPLQVGRSYGDYSLFAIRIAPELEPGTYTPFGNGPGRFEVYFEDGTLVAEGTYDEGASLANGTQQTVVLDDLFELDLRSQSQPTLAGLAQSLFDGCHHVVVVPATEIVAGGVYEQILVEAVTPHASAESGTYTLFATSGNAGQVELRREGAPVATLDYDWMITIGAGNSFSFEFPEQLTLTVTRSMGTSNLFAVTPALFDNRHEIIIP